MKKILTNLLLLLFIGGCIQENPDLVNPPLVVETVSVRFVNLAGDKAARSLLLDTKVISTELPFNSVSDAERPPFDSVDVKLYSPDNTLTYASRAKLKFGRLSNYIMLSLPNLARRYGPDTGFVNTDTLIYIQSNTLQPDDTNKCYVKFLNANPDTASTYSIKVGCPSGEHLFVDNSITTVSYLQSTGTQAIYAGKSVISIIKNPRHVDSTQPAGSNVVGVFELNLTAGGQYAIIMNTLDDVMLFDELQPEVPPEILLPVLERTANVRTINLTAGAVSVAADDAGSLANGLSAQQISPYQSVATCNTMNLDRIVLSDGAGQATDTAFLSFDIYKNYSLFAFEQAAGGHSLVVLPPLAARTQPRAGMACVRSINGNYSSAGLTVTSGAATSSTLSSGYSSGIVLAANLPAGEYSEPVYVPAGTFPVAAFAATQPSQYLYSGIVTIEAGKDYVLCFDSRDSGTISIVENQQSGTAVDAASRAAFVQVANVTTADMEIGLNTATVGPIVGQGLLGGGDLMSTFLPLGDNILTTGSSTLNFINSSLQQRTLLIAGADLFALQGNSMHRPGQLVWRIINAAADCPQLNVLHIDKGDTARYDGIAYQTACSPVQYPRDKKYSFIFQDAQTGKELYVAQDLLMTVNKNYSIIFYGDARSGRRILILQEY